MKVIISNCITQKFSGYRIMKSFEDVLKYTGDVDFIILHSSVEKDFDAGLALSKLNDKGIKTIAYINSKPSQTLRMCVLAIGGVYQEEEYYFDDEEDLNFLVDDITSNTKSIAVCDSLATNMEIITDFIQAYTRHDAKINTRFYLDTVQKALKEIGKQTKLQTATVKTVSLSAMDIFNQVSSILDNMQQSRDELEKKFSEAESLLRKQNSEQQSPIIGMQQVFLFPSYNYLGQSKILHVCEVSPCKFLTSFMLAYFDYLKIKQNKRVKLIFVHQSNPRSLVKYVDFARIRAETLSMQDLVKSEIVVTDTPKEDVMKVLTRQNDEIILILDRMYGEPIIKGQFKTLYAVSGTSDLKKHNLVAKRVIFSELNYPDCFLTIPKITNYSTSSSENRAAQYYQLCKKQFGKLDNFLDITES